jgi:hydroxymethylpyrimidine/phosphomethylpyrimidine kinase
MSSVLVIAGLDPTAGAGILADARVCADHGARAVGVCTGLTVQDTHGVHTTSLVPSMVVGDQLKLLMEDVPVDAVKIGMLGDERIARVVLKTLEPYALPIVWDPVLRPTRGKAPLFAGDLAGLAAELLLRCAVVTPNLEEVEAMTGVRVTDLQTMRQAAEALRDAGTPAVLVKGGHLSGVRALDLLLDGPNEVFLDGERLDVGPVHGTGCVLSTALACGLAAGRTLQVAAGMAKQYLDGKLRALLRVGGGARCLV